MCLKPVVFWGLTPSSLADSNQCFRVPCCLHHLDAPDHTALHPRKPKFSYWYVKTYRGYSFPCCVTVLLEPLHSTVNCLFKWGELEIRHITPQFSITCSFLELAISLGWVITNFTFKSKSLSNGLCNCTYGDLVLFIHC